LASRSLDIYTKENQMSCTPRSRGYGNVIATYIRRSKNSHIYMLSISTGKNQSTKVRGELYISTYEYNYRVIKGCDIILHECNITDMAQMREYKKIYNNELYKRRLRVITGKI